jgi:hypothetical protein
MCLYIKEILFISRIVNEKKRCDRKRNAGEKNPLLFTIVSLKFDTSERF